MKLENNFKYLSQEGKKQIEGALDKNKIEEFIRNIIPKTPL